MLEQVCQVRLWGVEHGEVLTLQITQIPADRTLVRIDRMHVVDDTESEQPPDDAGHLQRQLVTGRKAVDPPGHHCLHCVGEARRAQIARAGCDGADTVGDTDQPGVAQRVGELLAEERVALGALLNQGSGRLGQPPDAEAAAHQAQGVMRAQRLQLQAFGRRICTNVAVLGRQRLHEGPGRKYQQQCLDLCDHLASLRPRS